MLTLRNISKQFPDADSPALHDVNLNMYRGEILCLLGPSGCGKTTLLRVIAGLEEAYSGTVMIDGLAIDRVPVYKREFGLMFQEFALFPHMSVAHNITFGLRMRKISRAEQQRRLQEVLELVGLAGFADRDVGQLSGGERQRVALARSLAPNPRLLMLDEPLASVDATLKSRLMIDLRRIIKKVGLTAVYVTHDQREAFGVSDRVAIMNEGRIEQIGTARSIYSDPRTVFVARFLGMRNILTPEVSSRLIGYDTTQPVLIHPDGIQIGQGHYTIQGEVIDCMFLGRTYDIQVRMADGVDLMFQTTSPCRVGDVIDVGFGEDAVIKLSG